ncbi:MAG TPA: hypothetical protein VFA20_03885, partial [Myxococcaceae bacterium]|nr:hypothetical protein [Myxococcaceae bacterium]
PAKSLVAGALSPLTLKDVMDTMLGSVINTPMDEVLKTVSIQGTQTFNVPGTLAPDLDGLVFDKVSAAFQANGKIAIPSAASSLLLVVSAKGSVWHLTDLTTMKHYQLKKTGDQIQVSLMPQFYFAPAPTRLGATTYPQGYALHGALNFAGFKASADIDIATAKGVAVDAQMDRIVLGNQDLFCIAAAQGSGGPRVSISTYAQPNHPVKQFQPPHFSVNGQLSMLGVKESVFASLTTKGLELDVKGLVAPATTLDVHATLGGSGLNLGGGVKCGVGTIDLGELGKIKVNTDVDGAMGITVNAQQIDAWVQGGLQFMGEHINIGRAKLDTSPDAIAKLADTMAKKVEVELRKLFADADEWANAVKGGLVDGVNDTAKVFRDVYKKSAKEAADVAKSISGAAGSVVDDTKDLAKDTGKAISSGTKSAGKKIKKWFS